MSGATLADFLTVGNSVAFCDTATDEAIIDKILVRRVNSSNSCEVCKELPDEDYLRSVCAVGALSDDEKGALHKLAHSHNIGSNGICRHHQALIGAHEANGAMALLTECYSQLCPCLLQSRSRQKASVFGIKALFHSLNCSEFMTRVQ